MHLDLPVDKNLISDVVNSVDKKTAADILEQIEGAMDGRPRADAVVALGIALRRIASAQEGSPEPPSLASVCGMVAAFALGKDSVLEAEATAGGQP